MLLSHTRVTGIAWSISTNGAGVSFATSTAQLTDGRPGSVSRFVWPSHANPDLAWVQMEGTWTAPATTRFIGILNINMFQGTEIQITFRRFGTSTYDAPAGSVYVERLANGVHVAYASLPDLGFSYSGVRIKMLAYNAVFGGASIFVGTPVDIGEIWLGQLQDVPIKNDWSCNWEDSSLTRDSELIQPWAQRGTPRRVLQFTPDLRRLDGVYGARQGLGTDVANAALEKITTRLDRAQQVVCVPRVDASGYALMARSAVFGTAIKLGGYRHVRGDVYDTTPFTVREAPVPV